MYKVLNIGEKLYKKHPYITYSADLIECDWDAVVSYRYRRKLTPDVLNKYRCINLHTSYLPFNRGAYPIFFAHWNGTPLGVTVHLMDEGIDTGNILVQSEYDASNMDLHNTWVSMNRRVQDLFFDNIEDVLDPTNEGMSQPGGGDFHTKKEFEKFQPYLKDGWGTLCQDLPTIKTLYYIDQIEKVRAKNNINWMDVLRVAVKADPKSTIGLIRKIAQCDNEINELLRQI